MSKLSLFVLIGLGIIAALAMGGALSPQFRSFVQVQLEAHGREVLATAEGDLLNDSSQVKVVKFKSRDGIFVEVLRATGGEGSAYALVDRVELPDKLDGLFNFHGHVTRLAITDVDGDGTMELLAPTFDAQLVPHLNIYKYDGAIKKLMPMQPPQKP